MSARANGGSFDARIYLRPDAFNETLSVAVLARHHFGLHMTNSHAAFLGDARDACLMKRWPRRGVSIRAHVQATLDAVERGVLVLNSDLVV